MHKPLRALTASLLLLATCHQAQACAILGPEERLRRHQENVARTKEAALALKEEADLVFIGTLSQLSFTKETARNEEGREVVLQKHKAVFDHVEPIKGSYDKGQVLEYTVNKNRIYIGCGYLFRDNVPRENGATERYLVYARDGKILRTNHIPWQPQVLSGLEEALVVREPR
jgi:hypothetical protein